ncbi:MAG TPA: glycosyl hydrolase 108 family protein [Bryobacteraceae bacterium]|nr:glycosyl hydrolase 108 family protein [Bryobacteraceae bacterium]
MATIRRHYDALRKTLGAVMILYLLFLGVQFAVAMRDGAQTQETDRIQQLERRIDRLDHELERVDAAQRLTRIETYIQTTKEAQAANRQMFLLILATLTLILVGVILLLVGRGPGSGNKNPPSTRGADFNTAVAVVLKHEGGYLEDHQTGEISKFGLTADFLRSIGLPDDRDSIRNLTQEQAIEIYRVHWWEKYGFDRIRDQRVATKFFDLAVNLGPQRATRLLQQALNHCGAQLPVDGILGERTIAAANEAAPECVLAQLRALAAEHYRTLAAKDPKYLPYLKGWLERASQ